jgi:hypothetical protein
MQHKQELSMTQYFQEGEGTVCVLQDTGGIYRLPSFLCKDLRAYKKTAKAPPLSYYYTKWRLKIKKIALEAANTGKPNEVKIGN